MKLKRILALVLALSLCAALVACGNKTQQKEPDVQPDQTQPAANGYQVTVLDGVGNPAKGVIVRFMQEGNQVAMQMVNEQGIAAKELADGTYDIQLQFTDSKAAYEYSQVQLTAENKQATIQLFNSVGEAQDIHAYSLLQDTTVDCKAYRVSAGATAVTLTAGERNYFLFTPTESGTYRCSLSEGEGTVGYYGQPFFVQQASAVDVVDNGVSISVRPDNIGEGDTGTTVLVLGIDAKSDSGILAIQRVGDYEKTTADVPYSPMQTTHVPQKYTLPEGAKLTYVDIFAGKTEDYQLVLGEDGFYHLGSATGPLMLINLGKDAPNLSLKIMIDGDGVMGGAPLRKYFFDESYDPSDESQNAVDHLVKKEDYTEIMQTYFAAMDEKACVYPLTPDLEYMIKNGGEGWWDPQSPNYRFENCNSELGWLFACCYIQ